MNALEIRELTKFYGKFKALDSIDLALPEGRIIGLLGKNGAGKSTLLKCLLGLLKCQGEILIHGRPINEYRHKLFETVSFIPDVNSLDVRLTVQQTIDFVSGINPSWNKVTEEKLVKKSNLPLNLKVSKLSKGMRTKLYLLLTISLDAAILILDEPTIGLDIAFRKEFFNTILGEYYDETRTIIISTHQVEEVEHILHDIIFIDKGKIVLHEDIEELKTRLSLVTVPLSKEGELMKFEPGLTMRKLGHVSGILPSDVQIEGADYNRPVLADIFLSEVGGSDE